MEPAFKIFKKGITDKPITILKGEGFNEATKRAKYLMLDYTIIELQ